MNFLDHLGSEIQKIESTKASHMANMDGLAHTVKIIELILPILKQEWESLHGQQAQAVPTATAEATPAPAAEAANSSQA